MEIVGMGSHVLECLRVRKLIDKFAEVFLNQVYTESEQLFCRDRRHTTEHYAAIWAGKEAVLRSLGTTWQKGISWTSIEIDCRGAFQPCVRVRNEVHELMQKRNVKKLHLTLAHSRNFATATAIAVG